jgi:hypothetical protein
VLCLGNNILFRIKMDKLLDYFLCFNIKLSYHIAKPKSPREWITRVRNGTMFLFHAMLAQIILAS